MAKNLKDILGGYTPKAEGEQEFVAKHKITKTPDANKNGDDVFNASKIKTVKRKPERHGYDKPHDEKVNEETMTSADKKKETKLKAKYDDSGMKQSMQKQYGAEKGKKVYFATIRKQAMESVEELDEAVSQDTYDMHHKRAMKAVEDIAKHLMKHKANCDKSNSKWAHSDGLWMVKDLSRQLEDTAHNLATSNERTAEMNSPVVDRG